VKSVTRAYPRHPAVLLESWDGRSDSRSFSFNGLEQIVEVETPDQVVPALTAVEAAVARGKHAAGFVSYEAASGLNPHLATSERGNLPLLWFGIFSERTEYNVDSAAGNEEECAVTSPELSVTDDEYLLKVAAIRQAIARGETYQVNFTARQRFRINGDPFSLYRRICRNQLAPYSAWINTGSHRILSASPELFFALEGDRLTMKPMKGTAARLPRSDTDPAQRAALAANPKERAENLMIVDLVRNDLGAIAETGSVQVPALFQVETYPTVHQMTSTVTATLTPKAGLVDIFRALFPCGSVTGAPKRHTMKIIREHENSPRGVYCGAIGYLSPGREAVFSVAIRTAVIETASGQGEMGVGSGITWESDPESELRECLTKGAFLVRDDSEFSLIETLRLDRQGFLLLERHLRRLAASAAYFGYRFNKATLLERLKRTAETATGIRKVRVLLAPDGGIEIESREIIDPEQSALPAGVAISPCRVDSSDPFLYHKTTRRRLYDEELRAHPGCYDVIFTNERDQVTEGSYNTIVISRGGELLTPALECGLLPGIMREELLEVGAIREAILTVADLQTAEKIWLVNSVRGWRECRIQKNGEES